MAIYPKICQTHGLPMRNPSHIAAHPQPPEIVGDKLHHFLLAGVASNHVVMVSFHYVEPELNVVGDVYISPVEYLAFFLSHLSWCSCKACLGTLCLHQHDTQGAISICCQRFSQFS